MCNVYNNYNIKKTKIAKEVNTLKIIINILYQILIYRKNKYIK